MKIKTITCHNVYNYGASLQAYALQRFLLDSGNEVEIIDYRPAYLSFVYDFMGVSPNWSQNFAVRWGYRIFRLPMRIRGLKRKAAFDKFTKEFLRLTPRVYRNNQELKAFPPKADVYIAGSDQIWNTVYENGRDPAFYLDFAESGAKRFSYAASFSTKQIVPEYEDFVREKLQKFDAITVREKEGVEILRELGLAGRQVLDPVFLLSANQWNKILENAKLSCFSNYIFVYDLAGNPLLQKFAQKLAKQTGKKILAVRDNNNVSYADIVIKDAGPLEFVNYLRNADYIVADSFHALAFSVIFEKEFFVFARLGYDINSRMENLLSFVGHLERYITGENFTQIFAPLDYKKIRSKVFENIDFSKKELNKMADEKNI